MKDLFSVGDIIYGFCNGAFGRDDYDTKICILTNDKFAVFQYLDGEFEGNGIVLNKTTFSDKKLISEWKKENSN